MIEQRHETERANELADRLEQEAVDAWLWYRWPAMPKPEPITARCQPLGEESRRCLEAYKAKMEREDQDNG